MCPSYILLSCVIFPTDPPGPPQNLRVEDLSKSSCTLIWEAPAFDGGAPVTGYYVERSSGYSNRWVKANREPISRMTFKFTDLIEVRSMTSAQMLHCGMLHTGMLHPGMLLCYRERSMTCVCVLRTKQE